MTAEMKLVENSKVSRCLFEHNERGTLKITLFDNSVFENVDVCVPYEITHISGSYEDWIDILVPERIKTKTKSSVTKVEKEK